MDWRQTIEDLKSVDINNLAASPYSVKVVGVGVSCVLLLVAGYWLFLRGQIQTYDGLRTQETALKQQFVQQKMEAAQLPAYEQQMKKMKVVFGGALQELPNTTHMPEFVTEVTQAGKSSGLQFALFRPEKEVPQDFYAELPIALTVAGTYEQLGHFVGDIAALPRIVTLGDVSVVVKKGDYLSMSVTAKTYRYLKHRVMKK
ncbi:type 4a pilus biogenesis protein PilO [Acidiferrobacter sp.]|uniref:type 4a pilus biogenesis protein PilO n=1 Tax=Acidiferrobacter sp. TaxID=1872107 RepID=UPI002601E8B5|nr:type 4a pilus biogenesis protein PilO [Acidiferrobacter sp.]